MGRLIVAAIAGMVLYLYCKDRWQNSPLYTFDDVERDWGKA